MNIYTIFSPVYLCLKSLTWAEEQNMFEGSEFYQLTVSNSFFKCTQKYEINFTQTFKMCLLGHYELDITKTIWGHTNSYKKVKRRHMLINKLSKS